MARNTSKRIVFEAPSRTTVALEKASDSSTLSKVDAIRLAVSLLSEISCKLNRGSRLILKKADGGEREYGSLNLV